MAKPNVKTNPADHNRAEDQSAFEDGETAGGSQKVTAGSGEKTRIDAAKSSEAESDWNFSSGSTGMAKETKIGLALCVLLIGAFSFVVYSKMNKQEQLEDGFVSGTDSSSEDAPPPFDDETHADFGGEPGHHHHHGHDHGHDDNSTFKSDGNVPFQSDNESTADNFDVPRRRRHKRGDHFEQTADSGNGRNRQHSADPWASPKDRETSQQSHNHRHAAVDDDPFAEASHRHTRQDARQTQHQEPAFGDDSEFGFEQDQPSEKVEEAKPKKKTWNLADFLDGGRTEEKQDAPPPQQQADTEENPFGAETADAHRTKQGFHDHDKAQSEQSEGFNPFASTEQAADKHDHKIQQSAGRTVVDDHDHDHDHTSAFGDDQELDSWGTDTSADSGGFAETGQSATAQSGSQTQVQHPAHVPDDFGFSEDVPDGGGSSGDANHFTDNKFGKTPAAPAPDRRLSPGEFGAHDHLGQQDSHTVENGFSQPFANTDDHHHDDHHHADDGHFLPNPDSAPPGAVRPTVYVVERGDNFWNISRKQYGAGRFYKALALYNRDRIPDPRKMRPGMKVLIPPTETLEASFPALCPWQTAKPTGHVDHSHHHRRPGFFTNPDGQPRYRVGSRDTLTEVAKDHLGRASRWVQIYALNRDRIPDPAKLTIGTVLRLPADASRVQLVRRSRIHR